MNVMGVELGTLTPDGVREPDPAGWEVLEDTSDRKLEAMTEVVESDRKVWVFRKTEYPENWDRESREQLGEFCVSLVCASPGFARKKHVALAAGSMGLTAEEYKALKPRDRAVVLMDYGLAVTACQFAGDDLADLLKRTEEHAVGLRMLFGVYMDRPVNALGDSGWDWLRGDVGKMSWRKDHPQEARR